MILPPPPDPALDREARLRAALDYAIDIIENYQMDLRGSLDTLSTANIANMLLGKSLADLGFCQGRLFTEAVARIRAIAAGESDGL